MGHLPMVGGAARRVEPHVTAFGIRSASELAGMRAAPEARRFYVSYRCIAEMDRRVAILIAWRERLRTAGTLEGLSEPVEASAGTHPSNRW